MTNPNSDTNETKPGEIPPHLLDGLTSIAKSVSTAYSQLIASLEPQVLRLIHANNTDVDFIESLLDQLLDICDDDQALRLYRLLCRHYWTISQTDTVFYINAYRSMWGSDND